MPKLLKFFTDTNSQLSAIASHTAWITALQHDRTTLLSHAQMCQIL